MNCLSLDVLDGVEQTAREMLADGRLADSIRTEKYWSSVTRNVMLVFGDLGKNFQFHVACSSYPHAVQGEWLYDMAWFTSKDDVLDRLVLALESEFRLRSLSIGAEKVDDDFMKLVQARAEVRVWLVLMPNLAVAAKHIENCKRQARAFAKSCDGDAYIFIVHDVQTKKTSVERFILNSSEMEHTT